MFKDAKSVSKDKAAESLELITLMCGDYSKRLVVSKIAAANKNKGSDTSDTYQLYKFAF